MLEPVWILFHAPLSPQPSFPIAWRKREPKDKAGKHDFSVFRHVNRIFKQVLRNIAIATDQFFFHLQHRRC
jgi:hypothetical protein